MITNTVIFPWNANFETGVPVIDEQHKKLVDLLNQLAKHFTSETDALELDRVFDELTGYALYHFKTEEEIWAQYLPAEEMTRSHAKVHQDFVDAVLKLKGQQGMLQAGLVADETISFLTHWLAFHILESDKHMAKIVLALQRGMTLPQAKEIAVVEMSGAMGVLVDTFLGMYDSLASRTMQLMREISERQQVEGRLKLSRKVIDSTLEAIFITDAEGLVIDANPAFCLEVQREQEQMIGMPIRQIKPEFFGQEKMEEVWKAATESGHWAGEILGRDAKGAMEAVWLSLSAIKSDQGVITHYVGLSSSISLLIQRQHRLEDAAQHDVLTGLPNRRLLHDRLSQAVVHSKRSGRFLAVCYLDLDGFKQVNDTLGHHAGDEVLRIVAVRLNKLLRGEDTVARLGGDEFVLLLGDLDGEEDAGLLLNRLLQDIAQPILINGTPVKVTASIGVTLYPRDKSEAEQLLVHADEAMYVAKRNGKSRYQFFS
ncbi:MAG: bacteriohemerythrin [Gallionella sp.]|nr:bacteriohemerythrin [Gallionella sp.]